MPDDFDANSLDDVIHGKLRLAIMAFLSATRDATFGEIKTRTNASDGNLSVHLRKLEEAGYIQISKGFVGRKPQTRAALTTEGRAAWLAYLDQLRNLIQP
ncbi:transcriptional regulator [Maricaulis sp. W15]|uniref:Transcriptional regulator n=1 Tax=Maricaulis maris TaxID=74318 RepID=A0A495D3U0_9PROT|nr:MULTISPECIES: transcriptional regulator [Maricaulis]OLF75290.1 transcriptional regulator [Maricaulis sp. W15]RKQ96577.1 transcriptional regulator [Maricaulis maris]